MKTGRMMRISGAVGTLLVSLSLSGDAFADTYNPRTITSDWKMTGTHWGSITFGADNITLDCAGNRVHSSSRAKINCVGNTKRCAIMAEGRVGIHITNCVVVGGSYFDYGVWLDGTTQSSVDTVQVFDPKTSGFHVQNVQGGTVGLWDLEVTTLMAPVRGAAFELTNVIGIRGARLRHSGSTGAGVIGNDGLLEQDSQDVQIADLMLNPGVSNGTGIRLLNSSTSYFYATGNQTLQVHEYAWGVDWQGGSGNWLDGAAIDHNEENGLRVRGVNWSRFTNNVINNNDEDRSGLCDADQDSASLNNTWTNNAIGGRCGTVPTGPGH